MWQTIKNNSMLRTFNVIILGVIGFGLAFDIMFGDPNNMEMGYQGMMDGGSAGYSLDQTLGYLLNVGVKVLLIALVTAGLIAVFRLVKKYLFEGSDIKMNDSIKNDPLLKAVGIILLTVLGLGIAYILYQTLVPQSNGYGMTFYHGTVNTFGFSALLILLTKVLLWVSIVALVVSAISYIIQSVSKESVSKLIPTGLQVKKQIACPKCNTKIYDTATFCSDCGEKVKEVCGCGTELKAEWKCCPVCGKEKAVKGTLLENQEA